MLFRSPNHKGAAWGTTSFPDNFTHCFNNPVLSLNIRLTAEIDDAVQIGSSWRFDFFNNMDKLKSKVRLSEESSNSLVEPEFCRNEAPKQTNNMPNGITMVYLMNFFAWFFRVASSFGRFGRTLSSTTSIENRIAESAVSESARSGGGPGAGPAAGPASRRQPGSQALSLAGARRLGIEHRPSGLLVLLPGNCLSP